MQKQLLASAQIWNIFLRKGFYIGDFDWKGQTYRGSHEPLVSTGLYERVQEILDGRYSTKQPPHINPPVIKAKQLTVELTRRPDSFKHRRTNYPAKHAPVAPVRRFV